MTKIARALLIIILAAALLIRVWDLNNAPVSLYWDEMDVGYQAYSILKTGRDYFGNFPGLVVRSFADFRAPILIYATIPFVAVIGLESLAVRLPSVMFGTINVLLMFILAWMLFKSEKVGLIAALLTAFAPWSVQYSRMAFEATLLLTLFLGGIISFLKGKSNTKWFILAGFLFGLTQLTYNTAKLFVPLFIIVLGFQFIRKKDLRKNFLIGVGIFCVIFFLSLYTTFFLGGGQRFTEVSILTDPHLASKTDYFRSQSAVSYTDWQGWGMGVRTLDKLIYNKATLVLERVSQNYLKVFSTDFLFISGDPNLRHSTGRFGEFFALEAITILFGFSLMLLRLKEGDKISLLLLAWIVFAPLPAVITRDGGTHATRLFFLFPVLTLLSSQGLIFMWKFLPAKINFAVILVFIMLYGFGAVSFLNHYFGAYKLNSAKVFQYGFAEAVDKATDNIPSYDYVIIDDRRDSALMNYLFNTKFDPKVFQSGISDMRIVIVGSEADKINNLIFMKPGIRDWHDIFGRGLIEGRYLVIVSSEQLGEETPEKVPSKLTENQKLLETIYYRNNSPAFYVIESKPSEAKL